MVASTIPRILAQLRAHEGGFVDHPRDPGGATKWGVTHATYDVFRRARGLGARPVREMTDAEYLVILRDQFWRPMRCDELPAGLDYAIFDGGWASGPGRGVRWLQKAVGVAADGQFGPATLTAIKAITDVPAVIRAYCGYRLGFMQALKALWSVFGKGWARRVAEVEALAVSLALAAGGRPSSAIAAQAEAEAGKADTAKTRNQAGAAAGAAVGGVDATQVATADPASPFIWVLAAVFAAAGFGVALLLWRAHVARQRARAYTAAAEALPGQAA